MRFLILCILLVPGPHKGISQGCSDAGFCTMGAMKPDQPFNKKVQLKLRSLEISFYRGTTPLTPIVYVATADLNFSLNSRTSVQFKLPYQWVTGRLAHTSGLGDISLCLTRLAFTSESIDINISLGAKIPTNSSDLDTEGFPLPMYYQTSLGTYDAIAGISLITREWLVATGIQMPMNTNDNAFLWEDWESGPEDMAYVREYDQANQLKRGVDIMLRVERNFRFSRINFSAGLLPIYRVTNDEFERNTGERIASEGAKGLALSGIITMGYNLNTRSGIKLLGGHRIVKRERNPDGLTRDLVTTISYFYRF